MQLLSQVGEYLAARTAEFDEIPAERKTQLQALAEFVSQKKAADEPAKMTFICTHNSRRSHLSQIWAAVAAARYGISNVETFSGGTEATAFNPRAVAALKRAGLSIESDACKDNPRYQVKFSDDHASLTCFSKVYSSHPNPQSGYCAIMTCNSADRSCPSVPGAASRMAISYEDPKVADDTDQEAAKYDERCAQICREMMYAFSKVESDG